MITTFYCFNVYIKSCKKKGSDKFESQDNFVYSNPLIALQKIYRVEDSQTVTNTYIQRKLSFPLRQCVTKQSFLLWLFEFYVVVVM